MTAERPILLVEDNADDEALTLRAFARNKIANPVLVARDGAEALDYLFGTGQHAGTGPAAPAVVLLDLNLPKLDGIQVLRRLRAEESTRLLPVVVLTSSREERDIAEAYSCGCNSYVRKPVDFERFVDAARQLGAYWLLLNEAPVSRARGGVAHD
ncbi:MAG TPA: response regulator [Bauldia sp.]|nr:response regulator [Bauldia sp.]